MVDSTNATSSFNATCDLVVTSANPFFMVVYTLVFLVGLLLNGFILKFYICRAQQQVSNSLMVYLKNLTAADFLLCLSLPLRITKYATSSVTIRQLYCSFGISSFFLNMQASILFMCYIAANRYLKIVHHSGAHFLQTVRAAHIISVATWVTILAPMITYTILFFITQQPLTSDPGCCDPLFSTSVRLLYTFLQACSFIIFLLVLVSLIFFYHSTSRRVLQAQQRQLTCSSSKMLVKSQRNITMLISIFCICFIPYYLVRLPLPQLWGSRSVRQVFYYLMDATTVISVLNVCLDPFVYFFFCKAFRVRANLRAAFRRAHIQHSTEDCESSEKPEGNVTSRAMSQTSEL